MHNDWLQPRWPVAERVRALMTTRAAGDSLAPFDSMNVGLRVGDVAGTVERNRRALADGMGATPVFLHQVHGHQVVELTLPPTADSTPSAPRDDMTPTALAVDQHALNHDVWHADASFTRQAGLACVVQVADCLPVLLAAEDGSVVGAAHAGWRGLAAGVLEATVNAMANAGGCEPRQLHAWMGPCIGPAHFEVGADVLAAFDAYPSFFREAPRRDGTMRWRADLPGLARARLRGLGVASIGGGAWCTVSQPARFFSYRRDKITGRHAAAIWLEAVDR